MGVAAFVISGSVTHWTSLAIPGLGVSFGLTFAALWWLFDKHLWRWPVIRRLHQVPDLEGKWEGKGVSSYAQENGTPSHPFTITLTIRQTFSRLEVFSATSESTAKSTMAGIAVEHAVPMFRFAFENTPTSRASNDLQRHPGMVEARITDDGNTLQGDYFSGRHRLRFGALEICRRTT